MIKKYKFVGFTKLGQEYKYFTKGTIYDVVDETIKDDNGIVYTSTTNGSVLEWLKRWYKFEEIFDENYEIHITNKGNNTYGVMKSNGEIIKRVETVKHPLDDFCFEVASEIIMDRLFDRENKKVKEVKRKAKVGEWVKVVNSKNIPKTNGVDDYKNGDILQIIEPKEDDSDEWTRYSDKNKDGGLNCSKVLLQSEYVVLENYNPNVETKPISKQLSDYTNEELVAEIERRLK